MRRKSIIGKRSRMVFLAALFVWLFVFTLPVEATSTINPNNPAQNSALSSAVLRQNFLAAYNDINALQALTVPFGTSNPGIVPLTGGVGSTYFLSAAGTWIIPTSGGITALTGDGTASGTGAVPFTLSTVNPNIGTFGSASSVPQLTTNGKGLITGVASVTITPSGIGAPTTTGTGATGTWNIGITGNAATVTTNANLTGDVTSVGNATTLTNAPVIAKVLTGFTAGAGTVSSSDSILSAFQKVVGNINGLVTGVSSVFGRSGTVTAQSGDYTVGQVTGAAPLASPTFTGTVTLPAGQVVNGVTLTTGGAPSQFLSAAGSYAVPTTIPGGSSGQVQANVSGSFAGLNDFFPIDAYGAVCDGAIFYEGVRTTNGSPNITVPANSGDGYPGYAFTAADVGKTITVSNPAQENTSTPPTTTITTTISSISGSGVGNTAVLATNMTFTSSSYQYASARMYKTDNKTAIQAALNAAGAAGGGANNTGGWVIIPSGVCATSGPLTFYGGTRITGQDNGSSILMLTVGSNSDMFVSNGFSSLTGTNSYGGVRQWSFENLMLDGNKMANTGSGSGTASGHGDGVRVYGFEFTTFNFLVNYFASDGWYSEWGNGAGSPAEASNGMEANPHDLKFNSNAGYAMVWNGPHDSKISYLYMMNNGAGGLLNGPNGNGSPLAVDHAHGYVNGSSGTGYDFILTQPYFGCNDCDAEGGAEIETFNIGFSNSPEPRFPWTVLWEHLR